MWLWLNFFVFFVPFFNLTLNALNFDIEKQILTFFVLGIVPGTNVQLQFVQVALIALAGLSLGLLGHYFEALKKMKVSRQNSKDLNLISL